MILSYPTVRLPNFLQKVYNDIYFSEEAIDDEVGTLAGLEEYYASVAEYIRVAENNQREFSKLCEDLNSYFDSKNIIYKYRVHNKTKEAKWYKLLIDYLMSVYDLPVVAYYNSLKSLRLCGYFYDRKRYEVKDPNLYSYNEFKSFEEVKQYYLACRKDFLWRKEEERIMLQKYVEAANFAKEKGIDISSMSVEAVVYAYKICQLDHIGDNKDKSEEYEHE